MSEGHSGQTFLDRLTADWDAALKAPKEEEFPGGRKYLVASGEQCQGPVGADHPHQITVT